MEIMKLALNDGPVSFPEIFFSASPQITTSPSQNTQKNQQSIPQIEMTASEQPYTQLLNEENTIRNKQGYSVPLVFGDLATRSDRAYNQLLENKPQGWDLAHSTFRETWKGALKDLLVPSEAKRYWDEGAGWNRVLEYNDVPTLTADLEKFEADAGITGESSQPVSRCLGREPGREESDLAMLWNGACSLTFPFVPIFVT